MGTVVLWTFWLAFCFGYAKASNRWPVLDLIAAGWCLAIAITSAIEGAWFWMALNALAVLAWLHYARRDYARRAAREMAS